METESGGGQGEGPEKAVVAEDQAKTKRGKRHTTAKGNRVKTKSRKNNGGRKVHKGKNQGRKEKRRTQSLRKGLFIYERREKFHGGHAGEVEGKRRIKKVG